MDFTGDRLDDIANRDQAVNAAEFIDNENHVPAREAHLQKQIQQRHGGGDNSHLAHKITQGDRLSLCEDHENVFDMDGANHIIQRFGIDGKAAEWFFGKQRE